MPEIDEHTPRLHITLLGDFQLIYDDEPVTEIDTPRLQSLLAYLLLHRSAPQIRHHVAFVLWPDSTEAQALTNLRNLLYHLRHDLPDAERFLHIDRQTVQWRTDAPFVLDVADFESALRQQEQATNQETARQALEKAVGLYQGDLLPSCYDDWIMPERERLRQGFVESLQRLIQLLETQRDYRAAISYVRQLLRHEPLREATYRRQMRLHALINERGEALRAYHACATVLQRELGIEPSPATREMYERLLKADQQPTPPTPRPKRAIAVPGLVGRRAAWNQLRELWRTASGGRPHFALVSGEAGIGKTRLAEELVRWADKQGFATATARCYQAEGELAYAPVAAWLRARPLPPLEPVWRSEIARLLPELLAEHPELPSPDPLTEAWQRQRFFEALAHAILRRNQPLLLMIDALQWCDQRTLEWLHYLLRLDSQARLMIVGTYRSEEVEDTHPLMSLSHALSRDRQLTEIALGPLTKSETATLAADAADREVDPELIDCLYRETEGNPLFVVEMVRAGVPLGPEDDESQTGPWGAACLPRPLPPRVRAAISVRMMQLSSRAHEIAELAATIGREFTFDVLAHAYGADIDPDRLRSATSLDIASGEEDALISGLDELWQRRIVREQGTEAYDFSHDKLREVTYARLSKARRRLLHRRVAHALEAVYADDLDPVAARVAAHYERAGQPGQAIRYYRRAAEVARHIQATEQAIRYDRRASALLQGTTVDES